ncbi:MAG: hypothetical protein AAF718_03225 [Pseudomonadota bacterium]
MSIWTIGLMPFLGFADELPAYQHQPPAGIAEVGIIREASDSCQQLPGENDGCMLFRIDDPIEDFSRDLVEAPDLQLPELSR